jgi:uncharacterized protein DUF3302
MRHNGVPDALIYIKAGGVPFGHANPTEVKSMIGDPFLNYFALGLLIFVVVVLFYFIIAIHDIPYQIAEKRNHPHQDAIHAAGWVSLFTLHALWPFLWIWAMVYRPERGWGFSAPAPMPAINAGELEELRRRIAKLESDVEPGA